MRETKAYARVRMLDLAIVAKQCDKYNAFNVYCRELAPGTVSLTGDRAQGDDSKH